MQCTKFVSTVRSNVLLLSSRWLPKLSPQPKNMIQKLKRVLDTNYMSIPFHACFVGFLLSWVNMAAVLTVLLGYHLETPGSIITWIKDHAVSLASHHGDIGSVSGPDGVRFMLDKVVLRHVFSSILVLPCHWNFTSSLCSFIHSYLTNDCYLSNWQLIKHTT